MLADSFYSGSILLRSQSTSTRQLRPSSHESVSILCLLRRASRPVRMHVLDLWPMALKFAMVVRDVWPLIRNGFRNGRTAKRPTSPPLTVARTTLAQRDASNQVSSQVRPRDGTKLLRSRHSLASLQDDDRPALEPRTCTSLRCNCDR